MRRPRILDRDGGRATTLAHCATWFLQMRGWPVGHRCSSFKLLERNMNRYLKTIAVALAATLSLAAQAQQGPVPIVGLMELSGTGATAGTNFDNGVKLAVKEINAAGGILGRKIEYTAMDTQTAPQTAKALAQKAVDMGAYVVMGPLFSGSIIVSMAETKRAEIPNFTGGEAANITQQGNPFIFRTSFTQSTAMPKVARYIKNDVKARTIAVVWVNNDFGKGGRDSVAKALEAEGIKVVADISTDPGQVDFSSAVLKVKQSNADAAFVYTNEEESARALREFKKQGYDKPIIGETTLTGQKVIELAGDAANGAVAHVGLTVDAPQTTIKAFDEKFQKEYKYKSDHNGMKGYSGMYVVKAITEKIGKFDAKAFAKALHGATILVKDQPGVLLDVSFDDNGDLDRESFMIKVVNGKQVVTATLPSVKPIAK
jgi:branched-chain amino acid transport system substrate-binding protein